MIYASTENPDFIMVTEFWLNTRHKHQLAEISLNGYNVLASRRLHKNGGGVLLYIKHGMKVGKLGKTDVDRNNSLYVEVTEKIRNNILGLVNRPPEQYEENYIRLCNEIKSVIKDITSVSSITQRKEKKY